MCQVQYKGRVIHKQWFGGQRSQHSIPYFGEVSAQGKILLGGSIYTQRDKSRPNACGYLGRDVKLQFMWRSPTSDSTMRGLKGVLNKMITTH